MNRPLIALALLIALLCGCFWSDAVMHNTITDIVSATDAGDWNNAYTHWEKSQSLFGALLPHQELDDVDRVFIRTIKAFESQDQAEYTLSRAELRSMLLSLPAMDDVSLRNIL